MKPRSPSVSRPAFFGKISTDIKSTRQLLLRAGGGLYSVAANEFSKIVRASELHAYPLADNPLPWLKGVAIMADEPVFLISLRALFGLPELPEGNSEQAAVLFRCGTMTCAALVDTCLAVEDFSQLTTEPGKLPPVLFQQRYGRFSHALPWKGEILVTLSLFKLLDPRQEADLHKEVTRATEFSAKIAELEAREERLRHRPTVDGYLELAEEFESAGLREESRRVSSIAADARLPRRRPDDENTAFSSVLNQLTLAEAVSLIAANGQHGRLLLETPAGLITLTFSGGLLVKADSAGGAGPAACRDAVENASGTFRFVAMREPPNDSPLSFTAEALVEKALENLTFNTAPEASEAGWREHQKTLRPS